MPSIFFVAMCHSALKALTDFYNAVDAKRIGFEGRAQMGGFGASLVLQKYPNGLLHHATQRDD